MGRGPLIPLIFTDWGYFRYDVAFLGLTLESPGSSCSQAYQTETGNQVKPGLGYSRLGALIAVKGIMIITLIETKGPALTVNVGPFTGLRVPDGRKKKTEKGS